MASNRLPSFVTPVPTKEALAVASITWRRGLRSELLLATHESDVLVLWERLPDLHLPDGQAWVEAFAWVHDRITDPERSAQRLIQRGWAETNPAYNRLAAPKHPSKTRVTMGVVIGGRGVCAPTCLG